MIRINFAPLGLILAVLIGCGVLYFVSTQTTTTRDVRMVQPFGFAPQRDYVYSETNLNNAQANNYNAQADVNLAVAEKVRADQNPPFMQTLSLGFMCGFTVLAWVIFGLWRLSRVVVERS